MLIASRGGVLIERNNSGSAYRIAKQLGQMPQHFPISPFGDALISAVRSAQGEQADDTQLWFDIQLPDGGIDRFASDADDLDTVVDAEFLTDRGLSQISLPMHKACGRVSGLDGQKHH
jgi:hypothetical protein